MKKIIGTALIIFILIIFTSEGTFAHPGRTDTNGGHVCLADCDEWGLKTGTYHYNTEQDNLSLRTSSDPDKLDPTRLGINIRPEVLLWLAGVLIMTWLLYKDYTKNR